MAINLDSALSFGNHCLNCVKQKYHNYDLAVFQRIAPNMKVPLRTVLHDVSDKCVVLCRLKVLHD